MKVEHKASIFLVLLLIHSIQGTHVPDLNDRQVAFASYYGDHMVLQRAPQRANVWGYVRDLNDSVTVIFGSKTPFYTTKPFLGPQGVPVWSVTFDPISEFGPYDIVVRTSSDSTEIKDVLFGDVWLCSGQSNMQFTVGMTYNAAEEIENAHLYPNIRVMTVNFNSEITPLYDFGSGGIMQHWAVASKASIGGPTFKYFSAVCWMYGRMLYDTLHVPIGLVASTYGGTVIEAWSSPDALQKCNISYTTQPNPPIPYSQLNYFIHNTGVNPNDKHVLWNAMINPLLNMTIYGVIWYQGESNHLHPDTYNCTFPVMIEDWRNKFYQGTKGQTDILFPFGFVQIGPDEGDYSLDDGFPAIRWHQTADVGYVPNEKMKNTFMAVAMDMADFKSPHESIHYRDKLDVARRLVAGGLNIAYHMNKNFQGPFPVRFQANSSASTLSITYRVYEKITVLNMAGFEVCCSFTKDVSSCRNDTSWWLPAPIVNSLSNSLTLSMSACSGVDSRVLGVRYAWRKSPCAFKDCAIYEDIFPAPPFQYFEIFS